MAQMGPTGGQGKIYPQRSSKEWPWSINYSLQNKWFAQSAANPA
jgi:hypothetical protein